MIPNSVPHYQIIDGTIYFYGGMLSSFAPRKIITTPGWQGNDHEWLGGDREIQTFSCREDFFQSAKAINSNDGKWVLGDKKDTWAVKQRGQKVDLRPAWDEISYTIMVQYMRLEVANYDSLRLMLLSTVNDGETRLAEDSPTDYIWGIRDEHGGFTGRNLLGVAWMQVRFECLIPSTVGTVVNYLRQLRERGWITSDDDLKRTMRSVT